MFPMCCPNYIMWWLVSSACATKECRLAGSPELIVLPLVSFFVMRHDMNPLVSVVVGVEVLSALLVYLLSFVKASLVRSYLIAQDFLFPPVRRASRSASIGLRGLHSVSRHSLGCALFGVKEAWPPEVVGAHP